MTEPIALADLNGAFDALRAGRAGRSVIVYR
jgi:Zn-dependent alcohol dehydrogenase